mmetsp:Transcript_43932/g.95672  ORF Transcript_43932/g.95672 Transcript_43932/m.95672 type:complete len:234 (+) Transcript_43932:460-1161(+)
MPDRTSTVRYGALGSASIKTMIQLRYGLGIGDSGPSTHAPFRNDTMGTETSIPKGPQTAPKTPMAKRQITGCIFITWSLWMNCTSSTLEKSIFKNKRPTITTTARPSEPAESLSSTKMGTGSNMDTIAPTSGMKDNNAAKRPKDQAMSTEVQYIQNPAAKPYEQQTDALINKYRRITRSRSPRSIGDMSQNMRNSPVITPYWACLAIDSPMALAMRRASSLSFTAHHSVTAST